mgnify:CR=1 FL=1
MKTVIYVMRELMKWEYYDCVYNGKEAVLKKTIFIVQLDYMFVVIYREMLLMNDEIKTLYKYAGDSIHCINRGDKEFLEKIVDNIHSLEPFDHPDMVIRLGEKVLAIEHFEFDASSFNRKGSMDKRELAKRNREFNELINNLDVTKEPIVITTSVKCIYSLDYYIKNFKQVFKKHLIKAAEYKSCLINNGMVKQANDITICFFIVDTTPLGCYYLRMEILIH